MNGIKRPQALARIVSTILAIASTAAAHAQSGSGYQKGVVRIVVTNAPGSAPDVIGRTLAQGLADIRGMPVIVETKVGVQGTLGGDMVVRSAPDGGMLLLSSDTVPTVLPHMPEKMPFNPLTDLKPIALVADAAYVLIANPSLKARTLGEFIAIAKAKPGAIDYASTGYNSPHNRIMIQIMNMADIRLNHIPYGSTGPLPDVLAGTIPVMWSGLAGPLPHFQTGRLVALAQSSLTRHPSLPNVPTADELGFKGFNEVNWFGIMGPAGMPDFLVQRIQNDVLKVVATPAFGERMVAQGMIARPATSEAFVKLIQFDYARNKNRIVAEPTK